MEKASVYALVMVSMLAVLSQDVSGQDRGDGPDKIRIDAENILDRIREGKDVYCGPDSVIIGDVFFDKITNKSIKSNIIIYSDIYGKVSACKEFQGLVDFRDATFHGDVTFEDSIFSGSVLLDGASFKGILNLRGVCFYNISSFQNIICEENAYFYRTIFFGPSYFYNSRFSKLADFSRCRFRDYGEFQHTTFLGRALFRGSTFGKETTFRGAEFARDAEFNGASFASDAIFVSVKCDGTMNFNKYGFIKLYRTNFSKNISLEDSRIKHIDLKGATLSNRSFLIINNCDFYKLDARWDDIKDHVIFDEAIYIKLINYFKSVGLYADADACYREYNHKSEKPDIPSKIINGILWITCDYGTDARRAPFLLVILTLIFAAIYKVSSCIKRKGDPDPQTLNQQTSSDEQKPPCQKISIEDSLYFSAMVLVNSSTDYFVDGLWRWAVLVERLIGWALLAIFIITIVRLGLR